MSEIRKSARFDGYVMLALGAILIWIGGIFDNTPDWAHHRLLVANSSTGSGFEKTVILMLQHRKAGSLGFVINRPVKDKPGHFTGGPMENDKIYALHSTDVVLPDSMLMKDIDTAVLQGDEAVKKLEQAEKKPKWWIIVHGYSGWGKRQLNSELTFGGWNVVAYDKKLVRETKPEDMWAAASRLPTIELK